MWLYFQATGVALLRSVEEKRTWRAQDVHPADVSVLINIAAKYSYLMQYQAFLANNTDIRLASSIGLCSGAQSSLPDTPTTSAIVPTGFPCSEHSVRDDMPLFLRLVRKHRHGPGQHLHLDQLTTGYAY